MSYRRASTAWGPSTFEGFTIEYIEKDGAEDLDTLPVPRGAPRDPSMGVSEVEDGDLEKRTYDSVGLANLFRGAVFQGSPQFEQLVSVMAGPLPIEGFALVTVRKDHKIAGPTTLLNADWLAETDVEQVLSSVKPRLRIHIRETVDENGAAKSSVWSEWREKGHTKEDLLRTGVPLMRFHYYATGREAVAKKKHFLTTEGGLTMKRWWTATADKDDAAKIPTANPAIFYTTETPVDNKGYISARMTGSCILPGSNTIKDDHVIKVYRHTIYQRLLIDDSCCLMKKQQAEAEPKKDKGYTYKSPLPVIPE